MKCTNCGLEIAEEAVFCAGCGKKVSEMNSTNMTDPVFPLQEVSTNMMGASDPAPKKRGLLVAGIVAVIVVVIIAAVLTVMKLLGIAGGNDVEKQLVYQKSGVLYYVPNMDKDKDPIEIDAMRDEGIWICQISESGKYLYYRSSDERSVLYRAELSKLKSDSDKNSNYIEEIDAYVDKVNLIDDERFLYTTEKNVLYYYDGKQEEEIARDVTQMMVNSSGSYVYYQTLSKDETYELWYYDLSKDEGDRIGRDMNILDYDLETGNFIVRDGDKIVLLNGIKEEELMAEDSSIYQVYASAADRRVYYIKERVESRPLYDYVDDPYASQDAQMSRPVMEDYRTKVSEAEALAYGDKEYYAENPEDREYLYAGYNWNDYVGMYEYYNWETGSYYYCEPNGRKTNWYKFDFEAYSRAESEYENIAYRVSLRDELKNETFEQAYYDVYATEVSGDEKLLAEAVKVNTLQVDCAHQMMIYQKNVPGDLEKEKISIDAIPDVYGLREQLSYRLYDDYDSDENTDCSEPYYIMTGENEQKLDLTVESPDTYVSINVSDDGKSVIVQVYENSKAEIYGYECASDGLHTVGKIEESVIRGQWVDDCYYFTIGVDGYGDIVAYKNGKTKVILKNVYIGSGYQIFDDGYSCAYKSLEQKNLRLYNSKGDEEKLASNIDDYQYINEKRIVYKKNDNLYVYTGKEDDRRIARNLVEYSNFMCLGAKDAVFAE